jgi:hypothetical protein
MRRHVTAVAAAAILLVAAAVLLWPVDVMTVRALRFASGDMAVLPVTPGSDVRIHYRHSVERTPVEGRFEVDQTQGLVSVQTRFTSNGSGLPNTAVARMHREGDWFVVDEQRRPVQPLRFYLQSVNRTRLTVNGRDVALSAFRSGSLLGIRVEHIGRWLWWRWQLTGKGWNTEEW